MLLKMEEVHVERGTAGASSMLRYEAEKAFDTNYAYGWKSKNSYGNAPEMVWYKFLVSFVPAEVTFRSNGETQSLKILYWYFFNEFEIRWKLFDNLSNDNI